MRYLYLNMSVGVFWLKRERNQLIQCVGDESKHKRYGNELIKAIDTHKNQLTTYMMTYTIRMSVSHEILSFVVSTAICGNRSGSFVIGKIKMVVE